MQLRIKDIRKPGWFAWLETKPQWDAGGKLVGVKAGKVFPNQVVNFYDPRPFFKPALIDQWKKYKQTWAPPAFAEPVDDEAKAMYAELLPEEYGHLVKASPKATKSTSTPKAAADGTA